MSLLEDVDDDVNETEGIKPLTQSQPSNTSFGFGDEGTGIQIKSRIAKFQHKINQTFKAEQAAPMQKTWNLETKLQAQSLKHENESSQQNARFESDTSNCYHIIEPRRLVQQPDERFARKETQPIVPQFQQSKANTRRMQIDHQGSATPTLDVFLMPLERSTLQFLQSPDLSTSSKTRSEISLKPPDLPARPAAQSEVFPKPPDLPQSPTRLSQIRSTEAVYVDKRTGRKYRQLLLEPPGNCPPKKPIKTTELQKLTFHQNFDARQTRQL